VPLLCRLHYNPTARQWGLALDHIEEVEVVLANSSIVRASNTQNQDIILNGQARRLLRAHLELRDNSKAGSGTFDGE
jgi:FAD/FMN-containing dehydrogenase